MEIANFGSNSQITNGTYSVITIVLTLNMPYNFPNKTIIGELLMASRLSILVVTTAITASLITPSFAQTSDDEIIVTATKRVQSLEDVPIAVTALSSEELERSGVQDITRLEALSPSFNIQSSNSESQGTTLRIRGIGTTGNNIGLESSVGVFLDGVFLSRPGIALGDLPDVEQIEVLRGPQGTLLGRNTSAGALSIQSKKPNLQEFEALANFTYGNFDLVNLQGAVNFPVIEDKLALRLTGATRNRDGFVESTEGTESHDRDRWLVRGQALWEPTDAVSLRVIGDIQEADENCCAAIILSETPFTGLGLFAAAGLPANGGVTASGPDAFDDLTSNNGDEFTSETDQWGISAELNWDLGFADLTYIPAYREYTADQQIDVDNTSLELFSLADPRETEITNLTQEVRLQGTAWDDRLDWLIGGFYSNEDITDEFTLTFGPDYQQAASTLLLAGGVTALGPNPLLALAQGVNADGNFVTNRFEQDATSFSIFTHNIFSLTDRLDLTLGLRYVDEDKDGSFEQLDATPLPQSACFNVLTNPGFANPMLAPLQPTAIGLTCFPSAAPADLQLVNPAFAAIPTPRTFDDTFEDEELTYTANLRYEVTPNTSVYGSYSRGFKSGGFNLDPTAAVLGTDPTFESEEVDAYELGLKSVLFDGRVRANAALFYTDLTNYQVLEFTGIQFVTFNVPNSRAFGGELEVSAQVTDELSFSTGLTYSDAQYSDNCDEGLATPSPNVSNLCGAQFTNAPEFVGNAALTYEDILEQANMRWFLQGNLRFETDSRTSTQPTNIASGNPLFGDIQEQNAHLDFRGGIGSDDGRWTLEGWVQNVTDVRTRGITANTALRGTGDAASRIAFPAAPRTYGVTLKFKH